MVILKVQRDTYSVEEAAARSLTVREFIELLENENENDKVVFSNDNGYTYGYVRDNVIETD